MNEERVTRDQAMESRNTLQKYLEQELSGYDGENTWNDNKSISSKYLLLIVLNKINFF